MKQGRTGMMVSVAFVSAQMLAAAHGSPDTTELRMSQEVRKEREPGRLRCELNAEEHSWHAGEFGSRSFFSHQQPAPR